MIHPTAIVDPQARLADDVEVGAYSIIGADVEIGSGSVIGPHVVIHGPTRIGTDNRIYQFASVGEACQDLKYKGEPTRLEIGDRNTIREYATLHRGTTQDQGLTRVGSDNLLMVSTHVAHDCLVGDHVILSNGASLAGHVTVEDHVILSGFTLVHQFCRIGQHAFAGMGSGVNRDVPPCTLVSGNPAQPHGINSEGLKRRGFEPETIRAIKNAYKILYLSGRKLDDAIKEIASTANGIAALESFVSFLENSQRSIVR
ncbi:acyl-ACP--UDP-N-acetylglucosamine O-acyltransferase [Solemya velum gill symbiont]|uniref:Acyl-[acyl-carrier-protein]--UDP-N-acetylglucosamine O-acyltransferase n=1 Tax=Solemya velum gill symbiont TaxID=2340 RepID=A0A0B0H7H4_SOVGS|nr:acyl-ACP--UDP-N-acetylglucosamine O-acyltransferase [Solemya velum gill symbiont]KHF26148.1 acyl-(acyl-carrier-protein)-UDP-N-acetylglucosamine O-acyltransferase [Solemya velum gill symbiont]OOY35871.1 acyl-[acyl-carrier-protein]--UDP-N-acetylglucosamine O-acyltransferase [Solemya velum gill symbiont]OOY38712.1 acyl-[acyl-carrier-protein]--UDP-N-acetylglucosamine O-acyltransferase [Solemya velum gill symbiont]OOY38929.1 acyl-[acyl-carrier-protein]--UDP-N-acetylglucosamine O-acyltransferase [